MEEGLGSQNEFLRSQLLGREGVETREPSSPACDCLLELPKQNATAREPQTADIYSLQFSRLEVEDQGVRRVGFF